jgi:hypothetical protein
MNLPRLNSTCAAVASWALLLEPLLQRVLPAPQAAQLKEEVANTSDDSSGMPKLTPGAISRVLDLLGHVAPPGIPGCSYPGCCNLAGRSEAELPVQVCTGCRGVRYCCRAHQVAHWKAGHKEVCRAAQAAAKQVLDTGAGERDQV